MSVTEELKGQPARGEAEPRCVFSVNIFRLIYQRISKLHFDVCILRLWSLLFFFKKKTTGCRDVCLCWRHSDYFEPLFQDPAELSDSPLATKNNIISVTRYLLFTCCFQRSRWRHSRRRPDLTRLFCVRGLHLVMWTRLTCTPAHAGLHMFPATLRIFRSVLKTGSKQKGFSSCDHFDAGSTLGKLMGELFYILAAEI